MCKATANEYIKIYFVRQKMIEFDREKTCFFLNGKNYSYVMAVNGVGMLQHIYYGKKLSSSDALFLLRAHGEAYALMRTIRTMICRRI